MPLLVDDWKRRYERTLRNRRLALASVSALIALGFGADFLLKYQVDALDNTTAIAFDSVAQQAELNEKLDDAILARARALQSTPQNQDRQRALARLLSHYDGLLGTLRMDSPGINLSFSPNGKYILTNSVNFARVWPWPLNNRLSEFPLVTLPAPSGRLTTTAVTSEGDLLDAEKNQVFQWQGTTLKSNFSTGIADPLSVAVSADGRVTIVCGFSQVRVRFDNSLQELPIDGCANAVLSPNGAFAALFSDGYAHLISLPSGKERANFPAATFSVAAFSPQSKDFVTTSGNMLTRYSLQDGSRSSRLIPEGTPWAIAATESGVVLAFTGGRVISQPWASDKATEAQLPNLVSDFSAAGLAVNSDGTTAAAAPSDTTNPELKTARVWDLTKLPPVRGIVNVNQDFQYALLSDDGTRLLALHRSGLVRVANTQGGKAPLEITTVSKADAEPAIFGPNGTLAYIDGMKLHVGSVAVDTGSNMCSLAFNSTRSLLAVIPCDSSQIQLWDTTTMHRITPLVNQDFRGGSGVTQFSPDGQYLASWITAGLIRIWTVPDAERVTTGSIPGGLTGFFFSPDSKWYIVLNSDGWIRTCRTGTNSECSGTNQLSPPPSAVAVGQRPDNTLIMAYGTLNGGLQLCTFPMVLCPSPPITLGSTVTDLAFSLKADRLAAITRYWVHIFSVGPTGLAHQVSVPLEGTQGGIAKFNGDGTNAPLILPILSAADALNIQTVIPAGPFQPLTDSPDGLVRKYNRLLRPNDPNDFKPPVMLQSQQ